MRLVILHYYNSYYFPTLNVEPFYLLWKLVGIRLSLRAKAIVLFDIIQRTNLLQFFSRTCRRKLIHLSLRRLPNYLLFSLLELINCYIALHSPLIKYYLKNNLVLPFKIISVYNNNRDLLSKSKYLPWLMTRKLWIPTTKKIIM